MRMTMVKRLTVLAVVVGLGACGGKKGKTTPDDEGTGPTLGGPHQDAPDMTGQMVTPEKMDEIQRLLARKRETVSRCLSVAIDNKELPKNSHGKVTLDITISPSGHADQVKVLNTTIESKSLQECVIGKVKEIQFPEVPKPYPTSYTYAFEAS